MKALILITESAILMLLATLAITARGQKAVPFRAWVIGGTDAVSYMVPDEKLGLVCVIYNSPEHQCSPDEISLFKMMKPNAIYHDGTAVDICNPATDREPEVSERGRLDTPIPLPKQYRKLWGGSRRHHVKHHTPVNQCTINGAITECAPKN